MASLLVEKCSCWVTDDVILEFILTNMRKVQDGETELRELAVLTEIQATDITCCFTIHSQKD